MTVGQTPEGRPSKKYADGYLPSTLAPVDSGRAGETLDGKETLRHRSRTGGISAPGPTSDVEFSFESRSPGHGTAGGTGTSFARDCVTPAVLPGPRDTGNRSGPWAHQLDFDTRLRAPEAPSSQRSLPLAPGPRPFHPGRGKTPSVSTSLSSTHLRGGLGPRSAKSMPRARRGKGPDGSTGGVLRSVDSLVEECLPI